MKKTDFYFYSETEEIGEQLATELRKMNYNNIRVEWNGERYCIAGDVMLEIDETDEWLVQMEELAEKLDCEFDGYGRLIGEKRSFIYNGVFLVLIAKIAFIWLSIFFFLRFIF